jgi:hypothetical protein
MIGVRSGHSIRSLGGGELPDPVEAAEASLAAAEVGDRGG